MQGYPRVIAITPADNCSLLHLDDGGTLTLSLSTAALEAYVQRNGFPQIAELLERNLIVALPLPLRMTESEWLAIAEILQQSDVFGEAIRRFPKLHPEIHQTYSQLLTMPHHLYGGVGMYLDGKGLATFYTSHPMDFQPDEHKGEHWYLKLLVCGDCHVVWTHVDIRSRVVQTRVERRPWHYVTNESAD